MLKPSSASRFTVCRPIPREPPVTTATRSLLAVTPMTSPQPRGATLYVTHDAFYGATVDTPSLGDRGKHRVDQILVDSPFLDVINSAGNPRSECELGIFYPADRNHGRVWVQREDRLRRFDAVDDRHDDIHQHDVGMKPEREINGFGSVARMANHFEATTVRSAQRQSTWPATPGEAAESRRTSQTLTRPTGRSQRPDRPGRTRSFRSRSANSRQGRTDQNPSRAR